MSVGLDSSAMVLIMVSAIVVILTFVNLCVVHSSKPNITPDRKGGDALFSDVAEHENKSHLELVNLVEEQLKRLQATTNIQYTRKIEDIVKEEEILHIKKEYYKMRMNSTYSYSQIDYKERTISFADVLGVGDNTRLYLHRRNFDTGRFLNLPRTIDIDDIDSYIDFFIDKESK